MPKQTRKDINETIRVEGSISGTDGTHKVNEALRKTSEWWSKIKNLIREEDGKIQIGDGSKEIVLNGDTTLNSQFLLPSNNDVRVPELAWKKNPDTGLQLSDPPGGNRLHLIEDKFDAGELVGFGERTVFVSRTTTLTVAHNTQTAIPWQAVQGNASSWWNSSTKIIPDVAGTYLVITNGRWNGINSAARYLPVQIFKNGSAARALLELRCGTQTMYLGGGATMLLAMNGTTDYLETYAYQDSGGNESWRATEGFMAVIYLGKNYTT